MSYCACIIIKLCRNCTKKGERGGWAWGVVKNKFKFIIATWTIFKEHCKLSCCENYKFSRLSWICKGEIFHFFSLLQSSRRWNVYRSFLFSHHFSSIFKNFFSLSRPISIFSTLISEVFHYFSQFSYRFSLIFNV